MKTGFVSIVGRPNVGKSTLLNAIIGEKVAIVSSKPQTTRNRITGIYNEEDVQIVFVDTPGIHTPKNKLGEYMIREVDRAMEDIDAIIMMVEPKAPKTSELKLLERFKKKDIPVILVINKVDVNNKEYVAKTIGQFAELYEFASIVPASALKKDNVDIVKKELLKLIEDGGEVFYPDDIATDQSARQMVAEIIREKLLRSLSEEVPHGIAVETIKFTEREDKPIIDILADIICEKASHKGIVIGKNGQTLKRVASMAREDMEKLLGKKVYLECFVKVKEGWRDNEKFISEYEQ